MGGQFFKNESKEDMDNTMNDAGNYDIDEQNIDYSISSGRDDISLDYLPNEAKEIKNFENDAI
jgi:hypothetical protein